VDRAVTALEKIVRLVRLRGIGGRVDDLEVAMASDRITLTVEEAGALLGIARTLAYELGVDRDEAMESRPASLWVSRGTFVGAEVPRLSVLALDWVRE
jgi:hypothetical protein